MNNYVTWNDLIQLGILLTSVASFLYTVFYNKMR